MVGEKGEILTKDDRARERPVVALMAWNDHVIRATPSQDNLLKRA
jgi:hypothetical protein